MQKENDPNSRYRQLFDSVNIGIIILNYSTRKVEDVNEFFLNLIDLSKKYILGNELWEIGLFKNKHDEKKHFEQLESNGHLTVEGLKVSAKSGKQTDVELIAKVYKVDGEKIIQCNIKDVSANVSARQTYQRSEKRYRDIFEGTADALMLLDHKKFIDCNQAALKLFGYKNISQLIAKHPSQISPPIQPDGTPSLELANKKIAETFEKGSNLFEWVHRKSNGEDFYASVLLVPFELEGRNIIQATVRDITAQKLTEEKLRNSETKFRSIYEGAIDGILAADVKTKNFLFGNPSICKMLGYTPKELMKLNVKDIHPKKDLDAVLKSYNNQVEQKNPLVSNAPVLKKDGTIIYCDIVAKPTVIDNQLVMLGFFRDVTDRKVWEEKIKDSEYQFRESQLVALIGSYKFDFITNFWTSSEVLNKIFGIDADYFKNYESFLDIVHPEDRKMVNKYFMEEVIKQKKRFNKEYRIIRKNDKEVRWVHGLGKVSYDKKDNPIALIGTIMDITDRKVAEEKNKWLASFPVLTSTPILELAKDKGVVYFNPVAKKLFPDLKSGQLDHPFIRGISQYFSNVATKTHPIVRRELQVDGHWYLQSVSSPSPNILRVDSTDITELKNAQDTLVELKNRSELILESIGDAVFACDKKGIVQVFNKVAEEMTGIVSQKAIGQHYSTIVNFVRESDGKKCNDFIAEAIINNRITEMSNHALLVRKDGNKIPVADSAAPINDLHGNILGCVVVFHDVTKERKIDKAKTEFVSLASHQLRTPLSTINWYSEILLSEDLGTLNPKQQQYSKEVYHASQRMVALVNALLNVSRLELGTFSVIPKKVNIVKIAKTCIKELKPQIILKKLVLNEKYDNNIPLINVDPKLMGIVFTNLLSNSVKYSKEKGQINISISKVDEDLLIKISDTGIGIPQNQQKDIFGKLFRADNAKVVDPDGAGLGLYIVKEIITYTGGKVWFESREGKGTTFYASLPMSGMLKKDNNKQLI